MKRAAATKSKPVEVISYSRRTDGVADGAQLDKFISGLASGTIDYAHPKFALNKVKEGEEQIMCHYKIEHRDTVVSWWSKDFANLINRWTNDPEAAKVLNAYRHHFSFAINGEARSTLEPGLEASLQNRVETQLRFLVDKCRELGQDPDHSIMVKVDPITVYRLGALGDQKEFDTTYHIPYLFEWLKSYGLHRVHISFTQFSWVSVKSRCKKLKSAPTPLEIVETTLDQQAEILKNKVVPHAIANGITLQTCTAFGHSKLGVVHGACVGYSDVNSICGGGVVDRVQKDKGFRYTAQCLCYTHRDVGDKTEACTHGCRYCMAHPKLYDF